jgi:hypothetical protein
MRSSLVSAAWETYPALVLTPRTNVGAFPQSNPPGDLSRARRPPPAISGGCVAIHRWSNSPLPLLGISSTSPDNPRAGDARVHVVAMPWVKPFDPLGTVVCSHQFDATQLWIAFLLGHSLVPRQCSAFRCIERCYTYFAFPGQPRADSAPVESLSVPR